MAHLRQCRFHLLFAILPVSAAGCFAQAVAAPPAAPAGAPAAAVTETAAETATDHTPINLQTWGYNPVPGVQLTLKEESRTSTGKGTKVIYNVDTVGFPAGKSYSIWMMESGDYKTFPVFSGYTVDASGHLVCATDPGHKAYCFNEVKVDTHDYHKAEPINIAVISTDGTIRAYVKTYPFPVQAQDGDCTLTVTMANKKATLYNIVATGFVPGEQVTVTTTAGKTETKTKTINDKGNFAYIIDYDHGMGSNSGSETFTAAAKSCHPTVTYDWGKAGMKVQ